MVYRFIKFDDEMNLITFKWREIWSLLNTYHQESEDMSRRKRMCTVHGILSKIKQSKYPIDDKQFEDTKMHTVNWIMSDDRDLVWTYTVHFLRHKWIECTDCRLMSSIANVQCLKCNFSPASHYM